MHLQPKRGTHGIAHKAVPPNGNIKPQLNFGEIDKFVWSNNLSS